jgi:hypothetical protein
MLSGEATNTNLIVFGLTRLGLKPTIYRTIGEYANHYTTDAVIFVLHLIALGRCIYYSFHSSRQVCLFFIL